MRTIIFINGIIQNDESAARWLRADDYLIGADGGTRHCLRLGFQPDLVVGDLDSLDETVVNRLVAQGIEVQRHPTDKNQTDLELAIESAIDMGSDEILLLGALGGRMDQMLGNLLILAQREWCIPIRLAEENQLAQLIHGPSILTLRGSIGSTVSAIPLSEAVTGLTYNGLQYPLHNATLKLGSSRAMSNVMKENQATIEITSGILMVVQTFAQI